MKRILASISTVLIIVALSLVSFADVEPNGSPGKAEELELGKTYSGIIHEVTGMVVFIGTAMTEIQIGIILMCLVTALLLYMLN